MNKLSLRGSSQEDLDAVETIFAQGREFLRGQGLPQWQDGHGPNREDAARDIARGEGFVLAGEDGGKIYGYAALVKGTDEFYTAIKGAWDETRPEYISIHRVALSAEARGRGLAKFFITELISEAGRQGFGDIRVDTYEGNVIMKRVIEGAGFILRGEIEFPFPNGERLAYQLLV